MENELPNNITPEDQEKPIQKPRCPNCEKKMPLKSAFCPKCGQRNTDGKVSMRDLMVRLWNTTFHLESRFVRMVWHLFIPAKVTLEYFKGRQKRYPHPIQFFLIVMFFWLLVVNVILDKSEADANENMAKRGGTPEEKKGKIQLYSEVLGRYDTLPQVLKSKLDPEAFDTLMKPFALKFDKKFGHDSTTFSGFPGIGIYHFDKRDVASMPTDIILKNYGVTGRYKQWAVAQHLKSLRGSSGVFIRFFIRSLSWNILLLTGIMSFVLMMLYRKQRRFFVEHFVLLLHLHTGLVFISIFQMMFLAFDYEYSGFTIFVPVLWYLVSSLFTMQRYYQQSWKITIWKWLVFHILGFCSFALLMFGGGFISFLLF